MKKNFVFIFVLIFAALPLSADTITLNDGKKYSGVIIEYYEGNYVIKIKGKSYKISDTKVSDVEWTATQEEIAAASLGEELHIKKEEKYFHVFIRPALSYVIPVFSDYTDTLDGGMLLYGASIGSQGSNWGFALDVMYGSMSGTIRYREPGAATTDSSSLTSGSLLIMFDIIYRFPVEKVPVVPYFLANIGAVINFDSLSYYPMGWHDFWGQSDWYYDPDWISAGPVSGVYIGPALRVAGGLDIPVNEMFEVDVRVGYLLITKNRYNDVFNYADTFDFVNLDAGVKAGGLFADIGAKIKF